jgi:hypothetical protein
MGNFATIVFEGSFMKTLNGVGIDKIAMATMFTRIAMQARFQAITNGDDIFLFATRYATTKAVSPDRISKFLPSNVI